MNKWLKLGLCAIAAALIWFLLKEQWGWFNDVSAALAIAGACVAILVLGKVNWKAVFHKERELADTKTIAQNAVASLDDNSPIDFREKDKYGFEVEILESVPIALLQVHFSGGYKEYVFCEPWKDSPNSVVSSLAAIEEHMYRTGCDSIEAIGNLYLKASEKKPLNIWNKPEKLVKEVIA